MHSRKPRTVARRSLRNPDAPIAYPAGMKPVRAPFIIGAEYEFDNWIEGVYRLRRLAINAANKWATLGLDSVTESWRNSGVRDEEQFFDLKPRLVAVDRKQLAYDLQDVYVPLDDPDDELRPVVERSAELFARVSGTKKVSAGRTKATVITARKKLLHDVAAFAEANRIDPYTGRAL
jgi:hypothetical protein